MFPSKPLADAITTDRIRSADAERLARSVAGGDVGASAPPPAAAPRRRAHRPVRAALTLRRNTPGRVCGNAPGGTFRLLQQLLPTSVIWVDKASGPPVGWGVWVFASGSESGRRRYAHKERGAQAPRDAAAHRRTGPVIAIVGSAGSRGRGRHSPGRRQRHPITAQGLLVEPAHRDDPGGDSVTWTNAQGFHNVAARGLAANQRILPRTRRGTRRRSGRSTSPAATPSSARCTPG